MKCSNFAAVNSNLFKVGKEIPWEELSTTSVDYFDSQIFQSHRKPKSKAAWSEAEVDQLRALYDEYKGREGEGEWARSVAAHSMRHRGNMQFTSLPGVGQRSTSWLCNSVKVEINFTCAQLRRDKCIELTYQ